MEYKEKAKKIANAVLVAGFWLGVWHLCALWADSDLLIASPKSVLAVLSRQIVTGRFWKSVFYTLLRIFVGFAAAVAVSFPIALLSEKFRPVKAVIRPAVSVIRATPVASFILFLLVWCKNSRVPSVIVFLMIMPILVTNIEQGIENTDRELLEMARVFEFSPRQKLKYIYIPSVKPYFVSALLSGIGLAWKSGVAAEVLCTPANSLGKMIYNAKVYLETPRLFARTITVIAISMLIEWAVSRALKKSAPKESKNG